MNAYDVLIESIKCLLEQEDIGEKLKEMSQVIKDIFHLMPSKKHMSGRAMGRLEPTPSLLSKRFTAKNLNIETKQSYQNEL